MGSGSPSKTTTVQQQAPPQIVPEAREGFVGAQNFYGGILNNPPVYTGERVAGPSPIERQAYLQATQSPNSLMFQQPSQQGAEGQIARTTNDDYLFGPGAQAAVSSLAAPIFQQFQSEVLPGIRDRAQFSGQGISGTRRGVANENALNTFGRAVSQGAIAPIFEGERNRQIEAAQAAPGAMNQEIARIAGLEHIGGVERQREQEWMNTAREVFEEPLFRQSAAAESLLGAAGFGGGGGITSSTSKQGSTGFGWQEGLQLAVALASVAAMAFCRVAAAIYGENSREHLLARAYVTHIWTGPLANITRMIYRKVGPWLAPKVRRSRFLQYILRPVFDIAVHRAELYYTNVSPRKPILYPVSMTLSPRSERWWNVLGRLVSRPRH